MDYGTLLTIVIGIPVFIAAAIGLVQIMIFLWMLLKTLFCGGDD